MNTIKFTINTDQLDKEFLQMIKEFSKQKGMLCFEEGKAPYWSSSLSYPRDQWNMPGDGVVEIELRFPAFTKHRWQYMRSLAREREHIIAISVKSARGNRELFFVLNGKVRASRRGRWDLVLSADVKEYRVSPVPDSIGYTTNPIGS